MANLNIQPALSVAGTRGLFLNAAQVQFSEQVQNRILGMAAAVAKLDHVTEVVPGVNSLLVVFDPTRVSPAILGDKLMSIWSLTPADAPDGRDFDIPVYYGGAKGEDLIQIAQFAGLGVEEFVKIHSSSVYQVACVGAMPGFPYLTGLDPRLAMPRRSSPRLSLDGGSVTIGGTHAGITPCTAPSGWHVIGHTSVKLFDEQNSPSALLKPGDRIRFVIEGIEL